MQSGCALALRVWSKSSSSVPSQSPCSLQIKWITYYFAKQCRSRGRRRSMKPLDAETPPTTADMGSIMPLPSQWGREQPQAPPPIPCHRGVVNEGCGFVSRPHPSHLFIVPQPTVHEISWATWNFFSDGWNFSGWKLNICKMKGLIVHPVVWKHFVWDFEDSQSPQ